jgi:hypothetical protein
MPSGIIMQSSSVGATPEAISKVLSDNGYEVEKPEAAAAAEPVEPKRDDFENDEAFEKAQEDHEAAIEAKEQEEQERQDKEDEEKARRTQTRKPSRRERAVQKATEELRKENEKLKRELEGKKPAAEAKPAAEVKAPKREDFKDDAAYEDALFDYRYQQRRAKEQTEAATSQLEARVRQNFTNYQTQVAAFKEEHDDWDEVTTKPLNISESVYFAIVEEGNPQVTYHLGKNPDELTRLNEMTPYAAAIAIGRLSDKLKGGRREPEADGAKKKIQPKTIPEPVRPVSTSASTSTLTSRDAAKNRDYRAFKAAQRRGA